MAMESLKAVIFDLDGTLIDTERIYRITWPKACADLGYTMTDEQYLQLRSLGRPFVMEQVRTWFGDDFPYERARAIRKTYFDAYVKEHGIGRKAGAVELLEYLKEKEIVTAVATASDLERANAYLKETGLIGYFSQIISARNVPKGKPAPDVYRMACSVLGFSPEECIAVEDAPNGIRSAFLAGCKVIMVPDQSKPDEQLTSMLSACVDDLSMIREILEK